MPLPFNPCCIVDQRNWLHVPPGLHKNNNYYVNKYKMVTQLIIVEEFKPEHIKKPLIRDSNHNLIEFNTINDCNTFIRLIYGDYNVISAVVLLRT